MTSVMELYQSQNDIRLNDLLRTVPAKTNSIALIDFEGWPISNLEKSSRSWQTPCFGQILALQAPVSVPEDWK